MTDRFLGLILTALFFAGGIAPAAQAAPPSAAGDPVRAADSSEDPRRSLGLPPAAREGMNQTMREHLETLQKIVAALAAEQYDKAATLAHEELGFPKHHQAMQREQGAAFPKRYQELAMDHHQKAEALAKAISSKKMEEILPALDQTILARVTCHRAFKQ